MKGTFGRTPLWLAITALGLGAAHAAAQSSSQGAIIEIGAGAEHTDNAFKTSANERSETKSYLDLNLGYLRKGESFEADVLYNGEFANYEHDTTDDNSVIQGRSSVTWHVLPGRLRWDASHERSEQLQDSRNADIRNNTQLRDIITTGPTFIARMSPVDNLIFNGTFYKVTYDDSDRNDVNASQNSDSERVQGGLSWQHRLSKTDALSLSYQYMDTEFDDSSEEFTYQRLFGTYAVELASGGYTISLGVNRSERDTQDDSDGFLAQIGWRLATGGHRFSATLINELTDSGIGLGGNSLVGGNFTPSDSNYDVVDVVERTSFGFNYGYDRLCERCTIDVGIDIDEQDFDVQPRDQEQIGIRGSFGYRLTPTLRASLRAGYSEIEYPQDISGDRTDERTQYALVFDWRLSRPLTLSAWLNQDERDSDSAGQDYDELFGGVSLRYKFR